MDPMGSEAVGDIPLKTGGNTSGRGGSGFTSTSWFPTCGFGGLGEVGLIGTSSKVGGVTYFKWQCILNRGSLDMTQNY